MRSSRLPTVKRLADFDFTFQPSLRREQIDSLHELDFLRRKENVVFLGPPGVGKTHLAISLAIRAAEKGRRVYYGSLRDLVGSLQEAETKGQLRRRLRVLTHPALLIVDLCEAGGYVELALLGECFPTQQPDALVEPLGAGLAVGTAARRAAEPRTAMHRHGPRQRAPTGRTGHRSPTGIAAEDRETPIANGEQARERPRGRPRFGCLHSPAARRSTHS